MNCCCISLGGVPEIVVPDNLKAGGKSPCRYEPDLNPSYQDMAQHYGIAVIPTRSRKPRDKAKVEVGVQVIERWILARLRLPAFRAALEEQLRNAQYADLPFEERLALLVEQECTHRDNNRLRRRLQAAHLPLPATVEALDLTPARGLDRRLILQLAQGEWLRQHLNALVLGPTGVGKTFLATALAHAACRADYTVRYHRTARLLHETAMARADGSYPRLLDALARVQLPVLDDWLRDPLTRPQAQDLTSWTIATTAPPAWPFLRCPWPSGMAASPIPRWPMPFWTAWRLPPGTARRFSSEVSFGLDHADHLRV